MMFKIFTYILALVPFALFGQHIDCASLKDKPIRSCTVDVTDTAFNKLLLEDIAIIRRCLAFDSIDSLLINDRLLHVFILGSKNEGQQPIYEMCFNALREVMKTNEYLQQKKFYTFLHEIKDKNIDKRDSVSIHEGFSLCIINDFDNGTFIKHLYADYNANETYGKVFVDYLEDIHRKEVNLQDSLHQKAESERYRITYIFDRAERFETYEQALSDAKSLNKNLLLYFSSYTGINNRKFEVEKMNNDLVYRLISQDYLFYTIMVDNADPLTSIQQQTLSDRFSRKGQYYRFLQSELSNIKEQPLFIILDSKGNKVADMLGSHEDDVKFEDFLQKNLIK